MSFPVVKFRDIAIEVESVGAVPFEKKTGESMKIDLTFFAPLGRQENDFALSIHPNPVSQQPAG